MLVKPLPKSWLIHTVVYEHYKGTDDWDSPSYELPVAINFVRVDETTVFSRDTTQNRIVAEAVIYVDAVNSSPIPDFKEQSNIVFNGRTMTIKKVVPCYHPNADVIHHWELEVI